MSNHKEFDIIIIGNGVLGYSTAFCVAEADPDARIAIVGPAEKQGCASLAASAMLNSFAELERGALDSELARTKFEMSRQSAHMWPEWVERLNRAANHQPLEIKLGTYVIQNTRTDEMDDDNFEALLGYLKQYEEHHSMVDPKQIAGYLPATNTRSLRAVFLPNEGAVKSVDVSRTYEAIFEQSSKVELVKEAGRKIAIGSNGIKKLETDSGMVLSAPKMVIAAGAKSQEFFNQIPGLSERIPRLFYGIGTSIVIRLQNHRLQNVVRTPNRGLACGLHVTPYDAETVYVGASNLISPVPEYHPRMTSLYGLLQSAMEEINRDYYKARIVRFNIGHRPTTVDTYPLIGETSIEGLWALTGTKRDGLHMSPYYATSIAAELCGKGRTLDRRFLPERKPLHTMTREEGVKKAVAHLRSAAYQHELHLPKSNWEELIDTSLRNRVEEIYDLCGITDYGIPPEMLDMYKYGHVVKIQQSERAPVTKFPAVSESEPRALRRAR